MNMEVSKSSSQLSGLRVLSVSKDEPVSVLFFSISSSIEISSDLQFQLQNAFSPLQAEQNDRFVTKSKHV
ncbi:hypothetical protein Hanom_Chr11g00973661 [Helianthus anomalus]